MSAIPPKRVLAQSTPISFITAAEGESEWERESGREERTLAGEEGKDGCEDRTEDLVCSEGGSVETVSENRRVGGDRTHAEYSRYVSARSDELFVST